MTEPYVLTFADIDAQQAGLVGGKGANLGALSRIDGIAVPAGFCVTTEGFAAQGRQSQPATPSEV